MQKRTYYIPKVEIALLQTQRLMKLGDTSNAGAYGAAPARFAPVPDGGVKAF